jgi:hypothetical protein
LRAYAAPLVQIVRGTEHAIWDPGLLLARDEDDARAAAQDRLMRHREPIARRADGSPPRFAVRRVAG